MTPTESGNPVGSAFPAFRRTLATEAALAGRGVHSGEPCRLTMRPAPPGTGLVFRRVDLPGAPAIPATLACLVTAELDRRTTLRADPDDPGSAKAATVEHVLSAARGMGLDDAFFDLDGPEPPIADGSALPFARAVHEAGLAESATPLETLAVAEPVVFTDPASGAEYVALPAPGLTVTYFFTSDHPGLPAQSASLEIVGAGGGPESDAAAAAFYLREVAPARTFGFVEEIDGLLASGLAKGASMSNAVVIGRKGVVNGPLRFVDEPARHKALDFLGDMALLGRPLRGHFVIWKGGHRSNAAFAAHLAALPRIPPPAPGE